MPFDECKQKFNLLLVRVGQYLNPEEKNITVLAEQAGLMFGLAPYRLTTEDGDHLPPPEETGPFFKCPQCGQEKMLIEGLCPTCEASEGGKYQTQLRCIACTYLLKSPKHIITWFKEFNYDFESGTKASLGIKVLKDPGK